MATEIEATDEFRDWYFSLTPAAQARVEYVVSLLEATGIDLGHPYSSAIRGSAIALRELRVKHIGEPYRILYIFDPKRQAVLLVGGNKVGKGNRWYQAAIKLAEQLYEHYLRQTGGGQ